MATIDLGKLGFVNKGTYSSSTSYEKNDLVQYTDSGILSTYLYINASAATGQTPSTSGTVNGTYWAYYAKGGSTYTSTLTTQGDILYRDGSGEARLAAGTSGYFLKTQGSGANPIWAEAGGGLVQTVFSSSNTSYQNGGTSYANVITAQITPTSASNNILIFANSMGYYHHSGGAGTDRNHFWKLIREVGGSDTDIIDAEQRSDADLDGSFAPLSQSMYDKDNPNTTSQITYKWAMKGAGGNWDYYTNHNSTYASQMILMEVSV